MLRMTESPDSSDLQRAHGSAVVKLESCLHGDSELEFLRLRVTDLEREKSQLTAENHRLRDMLITEIPGLLSSMWQTLGHTNSHSVSTATAYAPYTHHQPAANHQPAFKQEVAFSPQELEASWEEGEESGQTNMDAPLCNHDDLDSLCSPTHQVEVFPGSAVLCDVRSYRAAAECLSPTAMARTLLVGVFDLNTLMNSNLRGGRSRRPAFQPQRNALDPHKITAIFNAVLSRFPFAKRGVIGSGINSKLSEIRFRSRRANQNARFL